MATHGLEQLSEMDGSIGVYLREALTALRLDTLRLDGILYVHGRIRFHVPLNPEDTVDKVLADLIVQYKQISKMADAAVALIESIR